jgi:hypothetical protein
LISEEWYQGLQYRYHENSLISWPNKATSTQKTSKWVGGIQYAEVLKCIILNTVFSTFNYESEKCDPYKRKKKVDNKKSLWEDPNAKLSET